MNFDYILESIIPENTGMITLGGLQGVEIPASSAANRPSSPAAGSLRFNTDTSFLEYWNGSSWVTGGTVTSVAISAPGIFTTSGTPITVAGTLTLTLATQAANTAFMGPTSGAASAPTFRALVASDVSSVAVNSFSGGSTGLTPSSSTTGAIVLAGALAIGSGGTGKTTQSAAYNALSPMTTVGDIEFEGAGPSAARLGIGSNGQVLTVVAGLPAWTTLAVGAVTSFQTSLAGLTPSTASTGAVTLGGTLGLASGGTGTNLTAVSGGVVFSTGGNLGISAVGTSGQVLTSAGTGAPTWTTFAGGIPNVISAPTVMLADFSYDVIEYLNINSILTLNGNLRIS